MDLETINNFVSQLIPKHAKRIVSFDEIDNRKRRAAVFHRATNNKHEMAELPDLQISQEKGYVVLLLQNR